MNETIGILHPGAMGVSVAAAARQSGSEVCWVSAGRSPETRRRAAKHGLLDVSTLDSLGKRCTIIISVCPPAAAEAVAHQVLATPFAGCYVDANAISPERACRMGDALAARGVSFVDGGIIGGPAWTAGQTWLALSGPEAPRVAACFAGGLLETEIIGETIGRASALKMCYAAYTKGTTALLAAILGTAEGWEVREDLTRHWERDGAGFPAQVVSRVRRSTAKAWRFAGEMEEIAATFAGAGLPGGFHQAAAEVFARLADFKGRDPQPELEEIMAALRASRNDPEPS